MMKHDDLKAALARIGAEGTPALRQFAPWVLDNLPQVAFHSIRGLAQQAGVNHNTVTRLARELGYDGFDAFRADVRAGVEAGLGLGSYGARARNLRQGHREDALAAVIAAHRGNIELLLSPETLQTLEVCIDPLLTARRVHAIGVRSCYSIAHYLSYVGGMAFANFAEGPSMPGAIVDQMSRAGPEDIVVAITYAHYSQEVVRGCEIARTRGARVLAMTDSHASPIAAGAWQVLRLPMAGPHFLPSLNSAFLACEMLLAAMAARSETAADRVSDFEARIGQFGGYTG